MINCKKKLFYFICNKAAAKANSMLGMMKRTFLSRNTTLWKKLYTTYIRPQLEFAVSAWNPYLFKDINVIENNLNTRNVASYWI